MNRFWTYTSRKESGGGNKVSREREVGHLQYISEGTITWLLNRTSNLSFHQYLCTFSPFFYHNIQTFYLTKHFDVDVVENQDIRFLSSCFCCEKWVADEYFFFVAISKPTKLPLCAADFPLFLSPQSCLICLFICLWCCCLLLIFPRHWQRIVS